MNKNKDDEIPESIRVKLDDNDIKYKNRTNKVKLFIIGISTIAASVFFIIFIGVNNPSLADNMPIVFKSMINKIHSVLGEDIESEEDESSLNNTEENKNNSLQAIPVNLSSSSNGLTMTIDRAMYDGNQVYFEFIIETDKPFKETEYAKSISDAPYDNEVKFMALNIYNGIINGDEELSYGFPELEFVNDNTLKGNMLIEFNKLHGKEANFHTDFKISNIESNEEFDGLWSFDIPLKSEVESYEVNVNKTDNGFTLNKVIISSTYVTLDMLLPERNKLGEDAFQSIVIKDQHGRELELSDREKYDDYNYIERHEIYEIGEKIEYLDIEILGVADKKTNKSSVIARFKVDLKDIN